MDYPASYKFYGLIEAQAARCQDAVALGYPGRAVSKMTWSNFRVACASPSCCENSSKAAISIVQALENGEGTTCIYLMRSWAARLSKRPDRHGSGGSGSRIGLQHGFGHTALGKNAKVRGTSDTVLRQTKAEPLSGMA